MLESLLRPFAALFTEKARLAAALKDELDPATLCDFPASGLPREFRFLPEFLSISSSRRWTGRLPHWCPW